MGLLRELGVACIFLTRLPIRLAGPLSMGDLAAAVQWFPVAGVLVGALGALAYMLAGLVGLATLPAAILAVAVMVLATGALHEDGLADSADALGAGQDRQRALAIMRDSRIGSYGTIALMLVLLLRVAGFAGMWEPASFARVVIAAAAVSRGLMPVVMRFVPQARSDGLAAGVGRPELGRVLLGVGLGLAIALALLPWQLALQAALIAAVVGLGLAWWLARRFGGYTGDTLGAVQQAGDVAFILAIAAVP